MKELAYQERCSVRVEDSSEIPSRATAIAAHGQNANSPFSPPLSFSTEPDVRAAQKAKVFLHLNQLFEIMYTAIISKTAQRSAQDFLKRGAATAAHKPTFFFSASSTKHAKGDIEQVYRALRASRRMSHEAPYECTGCYRFMTRSCPQEKTVQCEEVLSKSNL
jgi:hypothetical protein